MTSSLVRLHPKSETELAPEERLLRAIFGEKAADVKDTSLRVPSGCTGIVQDIRVVTHGLARKRENELDPVKLKKQVKKINDDYKKKKDCLLYTSPSPRDKRQSRMPSSA